MEAALQSLKSKLAVNPRTGRSYDILSYMAEAYLERADCGGKLSFEAGTLLANCGTAAELREKDPKAWIPPINTLRRALALSQTNSAQRLGLGYQAGGGRGNVSLYWLELESESPDPDSKTEPSPSVIYRRSVNGSIKPSVIARLFLRDGEMRNLSARGIGLLSIILLGGAFWVAFLGIMLLSLGMLEGPITMGALITLVLTVLGFAFAWQQFLTPWVRAVDECVVKAPIWITAWAENGCELEMFRQDKYRWTRLVRFSADCPICGSNLELRSGRPDQILPLVGRCIESPHAHVYSFDRMTLQGTYLGPPMPTMSAPSSIENEPQ